VSGCRPGLRTSFDYSQPIRSNGLPEFRMTVADVVQESPTIGGESRPSANF
jgi:hypothetical protein